VIKAQVGSSSEIVHKDPVEDDPQRRRPDISLAKKVLHWEPKVELEAGIQKTIDYFKKELSRNHLTDKDSHEEIANYQNHSV
jgi:UDP-glucuronate decarboxylase